MTEPAPATALARAWALKEACYAAWNSDPPHAATLADELRALWVEHRDLLAPAVAREIEALADWTGGIACVIRGQVAEAVTAFDSAALILRELGQPNPAAQTQVPKIMALSMLGQHAEAAACAERAQRELLALGNLQAASRVSQNLGALHWRRSAFPEAARHYREAAVLFARQGDAVLSIYADIGLADALAAMGDFDEALRIYARAHMRAGQHGLGLQIAQVDESAALVRLACGQYREALAGLESARRRYEALAVPQYLAIAEKQLGDAYFELRLLPEAWALFDAAVHRFRSLAMPDEQAWALAQRGRAEVLLGRAAAGTSFADAAALFAEGGNAVGQAEVALARGELALGSGEAEAARGFADRAAQAFAAAQVAEGQLRAQWVNGRALLQLGQATHAYAVFSKVLERAVSLRQRQVQVRCLNGQGLAALAMGDAAQARQCFEAAIERFEDQRRSLPGDDIRSAFLADHLRPYEELLRMALADGHGPAVLLQLDRFRARALDEQLAEDKAGDDEGAARPLRDRLNWLYRHLQRAQDDGSATAELQAEVLQTERDLLEAARRQRLAGASDAGQPAVGGDLDLAALQSALAPGDVLVEYGVVDDELFACVVTNSGVELARSLASWVEVLDGWRSARFQLDSLRHGAAPVRRHLDVLSSRMTTRLKQLHALVWAPLAPCLVQARRVLIVPHGELGGLPFAALTDGTQGLGERHQLAMAPSARAALRGLLRQPLPVRRALALAESSRLPHTAAEARAVAACFAQGRAWVGDEATSTRLREGAAAADLVHLACHAQFRADAPRFSALHLRDGAFTVGDAEALALGPCTVVLSACETGVAAAGQGDEMMGLVRGFLVGGAARVLASQWPVDDEVTLAFICRFSQALAQGSGAAQALAEAQAATRAEHPHPYFWGAFNLFGGW